MSAERARVRRARATRLSQRRRARPSRAGRIAPPETKPLFGELDLPAWEPPWSGWAKKAKQTPIVQDVGQGYKAGLGAAAESVAKLRALVEQPPSAEQAGPAPTPPAAPAKPLVNADDAAKIAALEAEVEQLKRVAALEAELAKLKREQAEEQ